MHCHFLRPVFLKSAQCLEPMCKILVLMWAGQLQGEDKDETADLRHRDRVDFDRGERPLCARRSREPEQDPR